MELGQLSAAAHSHEFCRRAPAVNRRGRGPRGDCRQRVSHEFSIKPHHRDPAAPCGCERGRMPRTGTGAGGRRCGAFRFPLHTIQTHLVLVQDEGPRFAFAIVHFVYYEGWAGQAIVKGNEDVAVRAPHDEGRYDLPGLGSREVEEARE